MHHQFLISMECYFQDVGTSPRPPSPLQLSLQPKSTHTPTHFRCLIACINLIFYSSMPLAEHRGRGSGMQSCGRSGHPSPWSFTLNISCSMLLMEHRESVQGSSSRGYLATFLEEHSIHTFHCSCIGPFHCLT